MEVDSVDAATEWDVIPAGRGHDGLQALAADGFSGGVTDGHIWAMLTNGRVVGVHGGEMADLADADLTAHEAPDPALPLLLVMRERSEAPRAQYYTEETPLTELDATLRQGGFTGYIELSENVLSGDYYLVYYGGDRMPVAFIGGSRRLETGEKAFDRATDEVGIYDIHDVDVSVVDVPGGADGATGGTVVGGTGADAGDDAVSEADGPDDEMGGDSLEMPDDTGDEERGDVATETDDSRVSTVDPDDDPTSVDTSGTPGDGPSESGTEDGSGADDKAATTADDTGPALDPEPDDDNRTEPTDATAGTADEDDTTTIDEDSAAPIDADERLKTLRAERDELRDRIEALTAERDELRDEVERLRAEVEQVENERAALRERLESGGAGEASGRGLSATAALSGTSLFVRYRSKAEPTLEGALNDGEERAAVDENLLLERHTTFETEGATVDGEPYVEFLSATLQYRFVEWLVRALPFELRDAAGKGPLGRLYKAIPSFDRAEIDGTVTVLTDAGEKEERTFDVVMRDRKGSPLAVASLFDGREPATETMLSELVEDARAAAAANESLGAAVFVTTSYYAPEALELAEAETSGGGLFGRGSRESYVRLDRSHGFHLCLVEARDDDFHLGVPDL
jgi:FtsZ-binding cell division protein ZapB